MPLAISALARDTNQLQLEVNYRGMRDIEVNIEDGLQGCRIICIEPTDRIRDHVSEQHLHRCKQNLMEALRSMFHNAVVRGQRGLNGHLLETVSRILSEYEWGGGGLQCLWNAKL